MVKMIKISENYWVNIEQISMVEVANDEVKLFLVNDGDSAIAVEKPFRKGFLEVLKMGRG